MKKKLTQKMFFMPIIIIFLFVSINFFSVDSIKEIYDKYEIKKEKALKKINNSEKKEETISKPIDYFPSSNESKKSIGNKEIAILVIKLFNEYLKNSEEEKTRIYIMIEELKSKKIFEIKFTIEFPLLIDFIKKKIEISLKIDILPEQIDKIIFEYINKIKQEEDRKKEANIISPINENIIISNKIKKEENKKVDSSGPSKIENKNTSGLENKYIADMERIAIEIFNQEFPKAFKKYNKDIEENNSLKNSIQEAK